MLRQEQIEWLNDFTQAIKKPGWVGQFVMIGPDDPNSEGMEAMIGSKEQVREYNRMALKIVNDAGKRKKLVASLKADLKRIDFHGLKGYGAITQHEYAERLLKNLLGDTPNEEWV